MTEKEMWDIVRFGALLGAGFEVATQIILTLSDAVRVILGLAIG